MNDRSLLISNTQVDGRPSDILIQGNRIHSIEPHNPDPNRSRDEAATVPKVIGGSADAAPTASTSATPPFPTILDGTGTAALPGLVNAHTHAAMALLRGYADDMPLMAWLNDKIWPLEAKLTSDDVYWGARLACLEMIKTGTTCFNDMYWHLHSTAQAAADAGLRACVADAVIDQHDPASYDALVDRQLALMDEVAHYGERLRFVLGAHAVYTVSERVLRWLAEQSKAHGYRVHIHVSETATEVRECVERTGLRPVAYLDRIGLLNERLLAVHCVHLNADEISLLAERHATVVHNPISNLKLASGGPMPLRALLDAGVRVAVGTDGSASNNNLDLFEELKFAALVAKHACGDPAAVTAGQMLRMATIDGADALGIQAGVLAPGKLADIILIDLGDLFLFPGFDLASDLVYSAGGRAVKTTICDGRVLMQYGRLADEAEIRDEVRGRLRRLLDED